MATIQRKLAAEFLGTALLVFFAVGTATEAFGFQLFGSSRAAGVVTTALAFGLVLLALAYTLGPISGCHVNPAVTLGAALTGRISWRDAGAYWAAQIAGGFVGAFGLWAIFSSNPAYSTKSEGLGADGWGKLSMTGISGTGAFFVEVILTATFVFAVLAATRKAASAVVAGSVIGLTLAVVHLVGIPLTGTSVNPARSLGPAAFVGGDALNQVWLFLVAPMVGAAVAAGLHRLLYPAREDIVAPATIDLTTAPAQIPVQPTAATAPDGESRVTATGMGRST